jgi:fatty acid CoA ligase FadD36
MAGSAPGTSPRWTLSAHKRPRQVHLVEQLPRNAMGKIQKTLLAGD